MNTTVAKSLAVRLSLLCLLLCLPSSVQTEQLPIKTYTIESGLSHDEVQYIAQDSHGFLWFCTGDKLSRFDGYRFTSYGKQDGFPFSSSNHFLESRKGVYWIATNGGGVSRFDPTAGNKANGSQALFIRYPIGDSTVTNRANFLHEDPAGNIWVGTDGGLFRLDGGDINGTFHRIKLGLRLYSDERVEVRCIVEDNVGNLRTFRQITAPVVESPWLILPVSDAHPSRSPLSTGEHTESEQAGTAS
jgi:ligand-binding sensor domain-containing protein